MRQLVTIDSSFDAERLASGQIYFINTQKLGSDKLLTREGDSRQHTLWETLSNTARDARNRFYVVIDEAHRGMLRTDRQTRTAQTILQIVTCGVYLQLARSWARRWFSPSAYLWFSPRIHQLK